MNLTDILRKAVELKASDLFLKVDAPPNLRINGKVTALDLPVTSIDKIRDYAHSIMTPLQISRFEDKHELDIAFTFEDLCRVRCNVYQQRGTLGMVLRLIPLDIYSIDELGLPPIVRDLTKHRQGLILVTGPTGCGKSTTLAAMIDNINLSKNCNIVTIEDPIEFVHPDKQAIVNQREVGIDTESFSDALKYIVRQSPDVILIGEMRDVETMNVALAASETGHLVFSTIHTSGAYETIDRIVNMFPPYDKQQVCMRMANSLKGIISQKLIPRADQSGRIAAVEIMIANPTTSKLIEEGRASQLYQVMNEGSFWGMITMNQCLAGYVKKGLITEEEAIHNAGNVTEMRQILRNI